MELSKIAESVQSIAEAIASVLDVEVTIVDKNLKRIAGTGKYKEKIGISINENSIFAALLKNGKIHIIDNPGENEACVFCDKKDNCEEFAQLSCPIMVDNKAIGIISLIAFAEQQGMLIINNYTNLLGFINRMSDLIVTKLMDEEKTERINLLASQLKIVFNVMDRGIIVTDKQGSITHYNTPAARLFQTKEELLYGMSINKLLTTLDYRDLLSGNASTGSRQFSYKRKGYQVRGVYNTNPIIIDNETIGIVFTFSKIADMLNIITDITAGAEDTSLDCIIGNSKMINNVKSMAERAARSSSTILIQGESGTGKELFARAIHFHSSRSRGPFIPINCAAIPEQLLESELFGYEEGAFTGSKRGGKVGKFELANRGTIFLDEIGDMPIHMQTKMLRVLQENMIEKVGGNGLIPIDVRIIAATNKDLEKKVLEGEFRQDLFYRLNVIPLHIPPLRNRKDDLEMILEYLLDKCSKKLEKSIHNIDYDVLETFMNYDWPGNVRELENTIEYAINMCAGDTITNNELPNKFRNIDRHETKIVRLSITPIHQLEKEEIQKAIKLFSDSSNAIDNAALALGIGRSTLYRKIKEYNL